MARMVKRLSGLEIDEVSLVDRPANQHGLVAIAKNDDQEDPMDPELYDDQGNPVDPDDLEVGQHVFVLDEDGVAHEMVYTENEDEGEPEGAFEEERELAGVGKAAAFGPARTGMSGMRDKAFLRFGDSAKQAGGHLKRNKNAYGAGAGGLALGYGAGSVGKRQSFGEQVLEQLSKAYGNDDRDEVISKVASQVEEVSKRNQVLEEALVQLIAEREHDDFTELAKSYDGLPIEEDDFAGVLQRIAKSASPEDLAVLDRVLFGASTVSKALYEELGYTGQGESDLLSQVYAMADGAVSKNAELGLTTEQAMTAIFTENPDAYDQYESEQRNR